VVGGDEESFPQKIILESASEVHNGQGLPFSRTQALFSGCGFASPECDGAEYVIFIFLSEDCADTFHACISNQHKFLIEVGRGEYRFGT